MRYLILVPKFICILVFFLFAVFCSLINVRAQEDQPPTDVAPPPLRVISKDERKLLESESSLKKRTQLSLDLMEARLKTAEDHAAQSNFQDSINELGSFQALLETTLNHLEENDTDRSKSDFSFKRFEMGLRKVISRLELVRRGLPFKYGYYVQKLQKFVRDARAKAIEPLFSDTVIPQERNP